MNQTKVMHGTRHPVTTEQTLRRNIRGKLTTNLQNKTVWANYIINTSIPETNDQNKFKQQILNYFEPFMQRKQLYKTVGVWDGKTEITYIFSVNLPTNNVEAIITMAAKELKQTCIAVYNQTTKQGKLIPEQTNVNFDINYFNLIAL